MNSNSADSNSQILAEQELTSFYKHKLNGTDVLVFDTEQHLSQSAALILKKYFRGKISIISSIDFINPQNLKLDTQKIFYISSTKSIKSNKITKNTISTHELSSKNNDIKELVENSGIPAEIIITKKRMSSQSLVNQIIREARNVTGDCSTTLVFDKKSVDFRPTDKNDTDKINFITNISQYFSGITNRELQYVKDNAANFYTWTTPDGFPKSIYEIKNISETYCELGSVYSSGKLSGNRLSNTIIEDFLLKSAVKYPGQLQIMITGSESLVKTAEYLGGRIINENEPLYTEISEKRGSINNSKKLILFS